MDLEELQQRIGRAIGLDARSLGTTVYRQAIERRMALCHAATVADYLKYVADFPEELQAAVEELVVVESWFFRHHHAFEVMRRHALAKVARDPGPYRVLSLPCAGGEEPYSIAITLRLAGFAPERMHVEAADISEKALARAAAAVYGPRALRAVAPRLRDRFFRPGPGGLEVTPELRALVHFRRTNILQSEPWLSGPAYDAIFCRNLLIYMTTEARRTIALTLSRRLAADGLLFVGHAEILRELEEQFEPLRERAAFAWRRRQPAADVAPNRPSPVAMSPPRPVTFSARRITSPRPRGRHVRAAAGPVEPRAIESPSPDLLEQARQLANQARFDDAARCCEQHIQTSGPSATAYHVLGMIHQAAGAIEPAQRALERAVYLDRDHLEALLALALLSQRRGDQTAAERLFERARRAQTRRKNL